MLAMQRFPPANRGIQHTYIRLLIRAMKVIDWGWQFLGSRWVLAVGLLAVVKFGQIFASDPIRVFYVNIETESGTLLERT